MEGVWALKYYLPTTFDDIICGQKKNYIHVLTTSFYTCPALSHVQFVCMDIVYLEAK